MWDYIFLCIQDQAKTIECADLNRAVDWLARKMGHNGDAFATCSLFNFSFVLNPNPFEFDSLEVFTLLIY